ncbi:MAG: glycoside hydrolase family 9 protein [Eubacterium sp.]|nr:glycoside hydrolase family 9 protein [Eubacterium sp.]
MKRKLRSLTAGLLVLVMMASMTACGNEEKKEEPTPEAEVTEEPAETEEPEATEEPEPEDEVVEEEQSADGNMIKDGDFDDSMAQAWAVFTTGGGSGRSSIENGEMKVSISALGVADHGVQVYYDGFALDKNAKYEFSFDARSTVPRTILNRFQINGGDYHAYYKKKIKLTDEMQTFKYKFTMKENSDPAPRLCFNCGYQGKQDDGVGDHEIYFDNIKLVLADASKVVKVEDESDKPGIRVNQVGFTPDGLKTAVFANASQSSDEYKIVDAKSGKEVYAGTLKPAIENKSAGETDREADFSDFTTPGTYKIVSADGIESPKFKIDKNVYNDLLKKSVKMLYMQRCGEDLDEKYAGKFAHPVCHTGKAQLYWDEDVKVDVSGGWHDAGDYGRYVVAGAKAAADVLLAYDSYRNYSNKKIIDDVGTPQSGDGIDDLLQEAKYELDWMLKMQDKDGKVYHKVTCANFPDTVMPQDETDQLILSFTSSPAAGDFVAVMSLASRIYGATKNKEFKKSAKKYLKAAKKSWKYLKENPDVKAFSNPDGIVTGAYPDDEDRDERFWAACELYRTTGDKEYLSSIKEFAEPEFMRGLGWTEVGMYGCFSALMNPQLRTDDPDTLEKINQAFTTSIDSAKTVIDSNPYGINRTEDLEWGSNMGIANDGVMFLMEGMIGKEWLSESKEKVGRTLNYLLGQNATGYCFVTGFGTTSPKHPHHRISQIVGKPVPGMLVGGPDNALEDPYAQTVLAGRAAMKCYADTDQSYSTNEVTIYWNSPLIYLLAGMN